MFKKWVTVVMLVGNIANATAQSLGYQDADNPSQAVGMMKANILAAEQMMKICTSRFPKITIELQDNLTKWRQTESSVLSKTDRNWTEMVLLDSSLLNIQKQVKIAINGQFNTLRNARPSDTSLVLTQYCRQHFSDLASGVWRLRTPKAYYYLDQMP